MQRLKGWLLFIGIFPAAAFASASPDHIDPVAFVLLGVTTIFFFAIIGRYTARRLHQPSVLGELLIGIFIGNLFYHYGFPLAVLLREGSAIFDIMKQILQGVPINQAVASIIPEPNYARQVVEALNGPHGADFLKITYVVDIFSRYGVIFLLFMVGLESSIEEMKHTGRDSFFVALLGVVAPMLLGFAVAYMLMPNGSYQTDLFIAATLSATSIGITARVLTEMKKLRTREAKIILGAAMLDDVLGLIILAVVSSLVISGEVDMLVLLRIIISAALFFTGSLFFGPIILRKAIYFFRFLEPWEAKLFISFIFIMALSWLASVLQLATIIGAFTAGIILHDDYFDKKSLSTKDRRSIYHLLSPLESILSPMFFIVIGIQVKLECFYHWNVLILASGLILAAVAGKLISGYGARPSDDRLLIGIGMLPRGEVGLVFASIGRTLGVISDDLFSAIVLMVMITTFIAPLLLKIRYTMKDRKPVHE
ncbi:cation:proton antiporter [Fluoribacter dumoffii]|uniref:K(+)/H(+) antiporter yhaU n=1 Tax=Fluoribacter dumoffii TaxID=463 RepID=A0A377GAN2_9GAMM|nr:cation:proton antiporter [Fluoribacter dumoffii]KTC88630.1 Na(+)/H(+) antiporter [Fluoribacter dumoffii NY 23]MCW8386078.1 cation:proton antiporter [Fluoribacter dumoffii]MCW8419130.1 cation:proton antiporter [Fluoribacter dumoffii]MCW8453026.1 cation:proton antiporter [Fluoribacter dumoffii]MCW8459756.1 cation:proton antiporter [Fluoribacter dumoffii]